MCSGILDYSLNILSKLLVIIFILYLIYILETDTFAVNEIQDVKIFLNH